MDFWSRCADVPGSVLARATGQTVMGGIAEGLLIGAGAGVVSAVILGLFHLGRRRWMQRDQVRFLRRFVTESFAKMQTSSVDVDLARDFPRARPEGLRPVFFEEFMRNMTATVNFRTTALSDNQVFELQRSMTSAKALESFAKYGAELAAAKNWAAATCWTLDRTSDRHQLLSYNLWVVCEDQVA